MSRPFRFKRFAVTQDRAAMKVGTDGVLLGAWCDVRPTDRRALDIGSGTGLIALMLAQRGEQNPLRVDAVEIDPAACMDAAHNVASSPWSDSIDVVNDPLHKYAAATGCRYDLIVCNPPFFVDSLEAPDRSRTLARHAVSLSHAELLACSAALLADGGRLNLIIPFPQEEDFTETASEYGLSVSRLTRVYSKPDVPPKRSLIELTRMGTARVEPDTLTIELSGHQDYSPQYIALTADFYLKF